MKKSLDYGFERGEEKHTTASHIHTQVGEDPASELTLSYAVFIAAVHHAAEEGRLTSVSQNLKRLAIRPLLYKMVYRLGQENGFDAMRVKGLLLDMEVERLLEVSTVPVDTFELVYATGNILQQYYSYGDTIDEQAYRLLFSTYLSEARDLFVEYTMQIDLWSKGMDLQKIIATVVYNRL